MSTWERQRLEPRISRVIKNRWKNDWDILKFAKYKSPPYKAKRVRLKQARKRSIFVEKEKKKQVQIIPS